MAHILQDLDLLAHLDCIRAVYCFASVRPPLCVRACVCVCPPPWLTGCVCMCVLLCVCGSVRSERRVRPVVLQFRV